VTPADQLAAGVRARALDGARGAACIMVVLHHCGRGGHGTSPGVELFNRVSAAGWAGVDLFFVLSGFLITGILLDARARPRGLRRFWWRRALRILPLAYLYLAVVFFSPIWGQEPWHPGVHAEQAWFWLYANNWLALARPTLDYGILAHFWSLAIEEQFYLIWPLVTIFLSPARLGRLCLIVLGVSVVGHLTAAALHVRTDLVHALTPSRLDGIVLGAWLAVRLRVDRPSRSPLVSHRALMLAAGAVAAVLLWPARGLPAGHPWVMAVGFVGLGVTFTLFLWGLLVSPENTFVRRIFEARPLVYLGGISYGLYILHMPVAAYTRRHWPPADGSLLDCLGFFTATLLASAALATVSWFAFERPLCVCGRD
jgi:peptidoglycan/LPS O-acetylase OafA/YrhL